MKMYILNKISYLNIYFPALDKQTFFSGSKCKQVVVAVVIQFLGYPPQRNQAQVAYNNLVYKKQFKNIVKHKALTRWQQNRMPCLIEGREWEVLIKSASKK